MLSARASLVSKRLPCMRREQGPSSIYRFKNRRTVLSAVEREEGNEITRVRFEEGREETTDFWEVRTTFDQLLIKFLEHTRLI